MKTVRVCLVALFAAIVLCSCQLKPMWDLAGKWQKEGGKDVIEFTRNGTLQFESGNATVTLPYKFSDPKHMVIDMGGIGDFVAEAAVHNDTLTVKDAQGKVTTFKKVK